MAAVPRPSLVLDQIMYPRPFARRVRDDEFIARQASLPGWLFFAILHEY